MIRQAKLGQCAGFWRRCCEGYDINVANTLQPLATLFRASPFLSHDLTRNRSRSVAVIHYHIYDL